jgi:hypothetical protein
MLFVGDFSHENLQNYLAKWHLTFIAVPEHEKITASYWGEPEAGLMKQSIYARADTPMHSLLHETCHYICMDTQRRSTLHTDAGGRTPAEENAVCYLQILLADDFSIMGRERMFTDMDTWGYSFRLGSAKQWFIQDAQDAQQWLRKYHLINQQEQHLFKLRQ